MRRRTVLATVGVFVTAGCLRAGDEGESTGTQTSASAGTPTETPAASTTATDSEQPDEETIAGSGRRSLSVQWRGSDSPIAVSDEFVYTYNGMELASRGRTDGSEQWRRETDTGLVGRGSVADDAVTDGQLYLAFRTGDGVSELRTVDAATGESVWQTRIDGAARSIPFIVGDRILLNVSDREGADGSDAIVAYGRETGEQLWVISSGSISSPGRRRLGSTDSAGNAYVTAGTASLSTPIWQLDPTTGDRRWKWGEQTPSSSPVYADGLAILGTYDGYVALDAETGDTEWTVETFDTNYEPPVVVEGTVYGGSQDTGVYAIGLGDGTRRWRTQAGGSITAIEATPDTVFAGYDGGLSLFEPDGTLATREQYDGGVDGLATSGDALVANVDGDTVVYRVSER